MQSCSIHIPVYKYRLDDDHRPSLHRDHHAVATGNFFSSNDQQSRNAEFHWEIHASILDICFFLYVFFGTFSQHLLPQFVQFKMPIAAPRSGDPENPQLPTLQFPRLYGPIPALDQLQCTWTADLKVTIRASFLFLPGVESVGRRKTDGKGWERMVNDGQ